ncbi:MAG: hypothetical protein IKV29_04335 [Alistipes sp.]|nr:hypothetical protein [Alistipes sp.]
MYNVSHQLYIEVADKLWGAIGCKEYFSGSVQHTSGDTDCRLVCTLLIERERDTNVEGRLAPIKRIVPIWWEFHTTIGSEEILNDFSFKELIEVAL